MPRQSSEPSIVHCTRNWSITSAGTAAVVAVAAVASHAHGFSFTVGDATNAYGDTFESWVSHPVGYNGVGGVLNISVGIAPGSPNASLMEVPTRNVISTWNGLTPTTGNLFFGSFSDLASNQVDYESVLLHEMGHALGLGHTNLASESGVSDSKVNYAKSLPGPNGIYNLSSGADGVIGSADDVRGDDTNLNWFKIADNNPFTLAAVVDSTTYSRDLADLPAGHNYSANAGRGVAALLGMSGTEAALQQGTFYDEAQRTLTADDVAGILYAASGVDEIAGTGDDYSLNLIYAGVTSAADIVINFDNEASFAHASFGYAYVGDGHVAHTNPEISFNTGYNWYFNQQLTPIPEPTAAGAVAVMALVATRRRRALA